MMLYPIYLYREDSGGYSGVFPDMPGLEFSGPGLHSAHESARKIAREHFSEIGLEGKSPPEASFVYDIPELENYTGGLWSAVFVSEI